MYLIGAGWHTEIALPIHAIHGPLNALTPDFPGSQYLLFGWGERNYYMARAPTFGDAMRALLPGPAVLLVTPLYRPPRNSRAGAQVFEVGLSTAGLDRLSNHVWAALEKSGDGTPRRIAAGPDPGSVFYVATGTYSATYTCNTWTAESLRVGGIPVNPAGVVFASQVTDQLRLLVERVCSAGHGVVDWGPLGRCGSAGRSRKQRPAAAIAGDKCRPNANGVVGPDGQAGCRPTLRRES